MKEITIRKMNDSEIEEVARFIAIGYEDDTFFHWCVSHDKNQIQLVSKYYEVYLKAKGSIVNVATLDNQLVGASVWLPHDVDASIYDDINEVVLKHRDNFQEVADRSHENEPKNIPFYQLVGVVSDKQYRGCGIGYQLLKHQIDIFDKEGIPTYLEASTPYTNRSVYYKFNYQPYGDNMVFGKDAILYPLYREALRNDN